MSSINNFINKTITTDDGVRINYSLTSLDLNLSDKPVLVFLHGLGGDLSVWDDYRFFFKEYGYESLAIDFRGHGLSEKPNRIQLYNYENKTKDVETVVNVEELKDFILIGHSLGGVVAQNFAIKNTNKIEKLILISTTPFNRFLANISPLKYFFKFSVIILNNLLKNNDPKQYRDHSKFYYTGDFNFLRIINDIYYSHLYIYNFHFDKFDFRENLKNLELKSLIIHGDADLMIPAKFSLEIHKNLKNSKLQIVKKANHIIVFDCKQQLKNLILDFLNTPSS